MKNLWRALIVVILACSFSMAQENEPADAQAADAEAEAGAAPTNEELNVPPAVEEPIQPERILTVNNGAGGGPNTVGTDVDIAPDPPPPGKVFDKWTGSVETVERPDVPSTHLVMPDYDIAVMATYKDAPPEAAGAFLEMNGIVVMEAEHATTTPGLGVAEGVEWVKVEPFEGAAGAVMQALPNADVNAGDGPDGPALNFRVYFQDPGEYHVFIRLPVLGGRDNSVNVGLDGDVRCPDVMNHSGEWHWTGGMKKVTAVIVKPGVHTVNLWMREDGATVDRLMLTLDPEPLTKPDDPAFPPENPRLPEVETKAEALEPAVP
jgi:hypothetical protein